MAALSDEVKLFVVKALACMDSPAQVRADLKQQFGLDVSFQQLQAYDPATVAGARMSQKLKIIFEDTRRKFREDVSEIPIANQPFRLRALQRAFNKVTEQGNVALAAQLLEQAAKETGGALTNRRELTGANGKPIETRAMSALSDAELLAIATGGGQGTPGT